MVLFASCVFSITLCAREWLCPRSSPERWPAGLSRALRQKRLKQLCGVGVPAGTRNLSTLGFVLLQHNSAARARLVLVAPSVCRSTLLPGAHGGTRAEAPVQRPRLSWWHGESRSSGGVNALVLCATAAPHHTRGNHGPVTPEPADPGECWAWGCVSPLDRRSAVGSDPHTPAALVADVSAAGGEGGRFGPTCCVFAWQTACLYSAPEPRQLGFRARLSKHSRFLFN